MLRPTVNPHSGHLDAAQPPMRTFKYRLVLLLLTLFSIQGFTDQRIDLVRVEAGKHGPDIIYQIFDGRWGETVNLSNNNKFDDFSPAIIRNAQGDLLVTWIEVANVDVSEIIYRKQTVKGWSAPEVIDTPHGQNTLPTLALDKSGTIWCIWVGFDGTDDEIFAASMIKDKWSKPMRIYQQDNAVPDYQPTTSINNNGMVVVNWIRFDTEVSDYVDYRVAMRGIDDRGNPLWGAPEKVVANPLVSLGKVPRSFQLPEGVRDLQSVAIYLPSLPGQTLHYGRLHSR